MIKINNQNKQNNQIVLDYICTQLKVLIFCYIFYSILNLNNLNPEKFYSK